MIRSITLRHAAATLLACVAAGSAWADKVLPGALVRLDPIVGVWLGQVTQFNCADPSQIFAQFEGWQLIAAGGTYSTTGTAPPTTGGPGFGYWYRQTDGTYFEKHRFVRFAPDGSVDGYQVVTKVASLSADRNQKSSVIRSERLAPDGSVVFTACASETSVRFE